MFIVKISLENKTVIINKAAALRYQSRTNSLTLGCLSYSTENICGKYITFQAKKKTINGISKGFTGTNYFPVYKKVPNGFKIVDRLDHLKKYLMDLRGRVIHSGANKAQITIISTPCN